MKTLYAKEVIELTKSEMKEAEIYGSKMYYALREVQHEFPNFKIVVARPSKRDTFKGLNREYMETYIKDHDDENRTIIKEFYKLCGQDENGNDLPFAAVASYGELKLWFLTTYPEIKNLASGVKEIMEAAKDKAAKAAEETAAKKKDAANAAA